MFVVKVPRSKYYQLVYFKESKRTTVSTKAANQRDAFKFLEEFKNSRSNNHEEKKQPIVNEHSSIKLSEFEKEYLEYISHSKSNNYIISIRCSFKMLRSFSGDLELCNLNLKILDKFISLAFSRTPHGAHHYYRTLKAAFNKAIEWQYISTNPFGTLKPPKLIKSFPAFISEDELNMIVNSTSQNYLKELFIVAFYTGMRLNELINMTWSWIDFENNLITVKCDQFYSTKSKKERIIPMCGKVIQILCQRQNAEHLVRDQVVFYRLVDVKLHDETVSKQFKSLVRKLEMNEKIHFHSLRHSFASLLAQRGISLYIIKELLGHEDLSTTQIYSHLQKSNLVSAINSL